MNDRMESTRSFGRRASVILIAAMPIVSAAHAGQTTPPNVVPVVMGAPPNARPGMGFNHLMVSVTVCTPSSSVGPKQCKTLDSVMIDTGSVGLRLQSPALPAPLVSALPTVRTGKGYPVAECENFSGSQAWGGLYQADVTIGGSPITIPNMRLQIVEPAQDAPGSSRPKQCSTHIDFNHLPQPTKSQGTLGIGTRPFDCHDGCGHYDPPLFWKCEGSATCVPYQGAVPQDLWLPNPIAALPAYGGVDYSNGYIIKLPPSSGHAVGLVGTLTFGIDGTANNKNAFLNTIKLSPTGTFTTALGDSVASDNSNVYANSYFDIGTADYEFSCGDFNQTACVSGQVFQPPSLLAETALMFSATQVGAGGVPNTPLKYAKVPFDIGPREVSFDPTAQTATGADAGMGAIDDAASALRGSSTPQGRTFVWGAPFFMGKRVAVLLDGRAAPWTQDPDQAAAGGRISPLVGPAYGFAQTSNRQ